MFTSLGYSRMRETGFNTRSIPNQAEWGSGRVWLPNAAKRRKSSSPGRKPGASPGVSCWSMPKPQRGGMLMLCRRFAAWGKFRRSLPVVH